MVDRESRRENRVEKRCRRRTLLVIYSDQTNRWEVGATPLVAALLTYRPMTEGRFRTFFHNMQFSVST
jgi:hypothetical protein